MRYLGFFFLLFIVLSCETRMEKEVAEFTTFFEETGGNESPTYQEVIDFYMKLAREFSTVNIQTIGSTDSDFPLHLVTYNPSGEFNFQRLQKDKIIILINNGIHPGEPDGIDASMLLFRDLSTGKLSPPEDVVIATIPVYNIGGALLRNKTSRVNQNGPQTYGFRGNTRNFDLNRDFVKADTDNAKTFAEIFHLLDPHIFIDTHVSNGADYQYVLTHLFTQHNKLGGHLGDFLKTRFQPAFEKGLKAAGWDITPFVNIYNRPPDQGFVQFMDYPRYSTGYTALWQTLGLMIETHMLKPYPKRVEATLAALKQTIAVVDSHSKAIRDHRDHDRELFQNLRYYPIRWQTDSTRATKISFKGYTADTLISTVTGLPRISYDRDRPFTKIIPFADTYLPTDSIEIPKAYLVKKGWKKVIANLRNNNIIVNTLEKDTLLQVVTYRIDSYETSSRSYEGHYPHYNTRVRPSQEMVSFTEGDYIISTSQPGIRYLLETLEPEAMDSFFNWNFFDPILQQKEGFSPYVFEDLAIKILADNDSLNTEFNLKKENDVNFSNNSFLQLNWIYQNSTYYEEAHLKYPVFRLME